jgi:hypothetical protein
LTTASLPSIILVNIFVLPTIPSITVLLDQTLPNQAKSSQNKKRLHTFHSIKTTPIYISLQILSSLTANLAIF